MLPAWRAERHRHALNIGRPPEHGLREIMNAILYVNRTGVQWRYLPHDLPPWETVYGYFAKWQRDGVFAQLTGVLRRLLRQKQGKGLDQVAAAHSSVLKVWVDGGYRRHLVEHATRLGIDREIVQRIPGTEGYSRRPNAGPWSGPTAG